MPFFGENVIVKTIKHHNLGNKGEENEVLLKAFLIKCHFQYLQAGVEIQDGPEEFRKITQLSFGPDSDKIPDWLTKYDKWLEEKDYLKLKGIFPKAKALFKADICINGIKYSVKSTGAAKTALINHTPRSGVDKVCKKLGIEIAPLDSMVQKYWSLRKSKEIGEDIKNSDDRSPFRSQKAYFKPILNYFLFKGTGYRGDSSFPADKILMFKNPSDPSTYKIITPKDAVDSVWEELTFSMRQKGMPTSYSPAKHPILAPWVGYTSDDPGLPKGSLHVRS